MKDGKGVGFRFGQVLAVLFLTVLLVKFIAWGFDGILW